MISPKLFRGLVDIASKFCNDLISGSHFIVQISIFVDQHHNRNLGSRSRKVTKYISQTYTFYAQIPKIQEQVVWAWKAKVAAATPDASETDWRQRPRRDDLIISILMITKPNLNSMHKWLYSPPLQWPLLLASKPFKLDLRWLGQRKYRSGKMYWMAFLIPCPRVTAVALINKILLVCTIK